MKSPAISVVAAVNNRAILEANLLRSPMFSPGHPHQLLVREGFACAGLAYNDALDAATEDIVVFVHQDVYFPARWLDDLMNTIKSLDEAGQPWGVLGCFGARADVAPGLGQVYTTGWGVHGTPLNAPERVETLDEIVLVIRKSRRLRFDPLLPHYHMYGVDLCLTARSVGLQSYVVPTFCIHNTQQLLSLPMDYFRCYRYIKRKWPQYLPIHTSCIRISRFDGHARFKKFEATVNKMLGRRQSAIPRIDDPRTVLPSRFAALDV